MFPKHNRKWEPANKKRAVIFLCFWLILILGLVWWFAFKASAPESGMQQTATDVTTPVVNNNATDAPQLLIGKASAPAVIVEYGDFKCPSCNQFTRQAGKELRQNYVDPGQLKIEFRNLPFIGPDSFRAAEGAFCAKAQGKFVEYHDAVYGYMWSNYYGKGNTAVEFEDILTVLVLSQIASNIGMDAPEFESCLTDRTYESEVKADLKQSEQDVATGTPFFVIAGQKISGPQPYGVYKTLVDLQLR